MIDLIRKIIATTKFLEKKHAALAIISTKSRKDAVIFVLYIMVRQEQKIKKHVGYGEM